MTQTTTLVEIVSDPVFAHGYDCGRDWFARGDKPGVPPTSEDVVQFIADNVVDLVRENFLDDERLRDNVGFLIGWISGIHC